MKREELLRDELLQKLVSTLGDARSTDGRRRSDYAIQVIDLVDAYVAAERERLAQAIEAVRQQDHELGGPAVASAAFREAARIVREGGTS